MAWLPVRSRSSRPSPRETSPLTKPTFPGTAIGKIGAYVGVWAFPAIIDAVSPSLTKSGGQAAHEETS